MDSDFEYSDDDFQEQDGGFNTEDEAKEQTMGTEHSTWEVLAVDELAHVQDEALATVMNILGCSTSHARTLLIHFRWNTDALFGMLAERGEGHVSKLAGCTTEQLQQDPSQNGNEDMTCGTCFCEVPSTEATRMECGHAFCNDCWRQHLRIQIQDGRARRLPCMGVRCSIVCDESRVKKLIAHDPEVLAKYQRSLLESYIEDNAMVQWCPSVPSCGHAVRVTGESHCEPECRCGQRFCFACGAEPHSPCTCDMWKKWRRKCVDDSETHNWISANSKPCPKCSKPVEKNGGCNLVYCHCGQAFCWLCGVATGRMHTWERIEGHSCGRYREEADARIDIAARNIKRFQHYQQQWEGQTSSQQLEGDLRSKVACHIEQLEAAATTLTDYAWLTQALDQLCEARRILGYSFVFAFYFFGDMFADEVTREQNQLNQNLFEDQQQMLQAEVEKLAMQVQTPPEHLLKDQNETLRLAVINCAAGIDKRFRGLYDVIENDLLGQLQFTAAYVAPYRGQTMQRAGGAPDPVAHAKQASKTPATVIDLTDEPASPTPSKGHRDPSPAKRQRMHGGSGSLRIASPSRARPRAR